jgi:hypothetical protein
MPGQAQVADIFQGLLAGAVFFEVRHERDVSGLDGRDQGRVGARMAIHVDAGIDEVWTISVSPSSRP